MLLVVTYPYAVGSKGCDWPRLSSVSLVGPRKAWVGLVVRCMAEHQNRTEPLTTAALQGHDGGFTSGAQLNY